MKTFKLIGVVLFLSFIINSCGDDEIEIVPDVPKINVTGSIIAFGNTDVETHSAAQNVSVRGTALTNDFIAEASSNFKVSLDDINYASSQTIAAATVNSSDQQIFVRFSPSLSAVGTKTGTLRLKSVGATQVAISLVGVGVSTTPAVNVTKASIAFASTQVNSISATDSFMVEGYNLTSAINLNVSGEYEISFDKNTYGNSLQINGSMANGSKMIYVRFAPVSLEGISNGVITISNLEILEDVNVNLTGIATPIPPVTHNYSAFQNQRLAFGGGFNQTETAMFNLHTDFSNIETINMYVKLRCPGGGCNAWDVFANIKVKDTDSGKWYEIGRYITPYGVGNSQAGRGFKIDVTDFKSLLQGSVELFARIETWGADGWLLSVDFDYIEGVPDYPYYAIADVLTYDEWSTSGVPYGVSHSFDLTRTITIPANAEATALRTIITGWGHATPLDPDGRPCAEWCYRTHHVWIDGVSTFNHAMTAIGCASNSVQPQGGNWSPDRAGWCPGMAVPVRSNTFGSSMAGSTFTFEYDYQDWASNGGSTSGDPNAYYATSCFVVVKSSTPIVKPIVVD